VKLPTSLSHFTKSCLRRLLAVTTAGIPKKLIKAVTGSGSFYFKLVKMYLRIQDKIQPQMFTRGEDFVQMPPLMAQPEHRKIYIDITSLTHRDAGGGIQRTQKKFLEYASLVTEVPIVPIASEGNNFYKVVLSPMSTEFEKSFNRSDELVSLERNDVFFSLDLNYLSLISNLDFYLKLSKQGTDIWFLIYDLLPIDHPDYFSEGIANLHESWLNNLLKFANVICISKTVQDSLVKYIRDREIIRNNLLNLQVYLGADFFDVQKYSLAKKTTCDKKKFIAVGTLEPRKGYDEILDVCERLWARGEIFEMHFIGKLGWKSEELKNRVTLQSGINPYLFWHSEAIDQDLDYHYATCDVLIAASFDEGFGLPIVEALQRNKVVFARKINIFEEVIGKSDFLFESEKDLELKMSEFLQDSKLEKFSLIPEFKLHTWQESTKEILDIILLDDCNESRKLG
jgi:glycosyltransferase involved in cell wall biosynthesis